MDNIAIFKFKFDALSHIHSGYSSEFAKFTKDERDGKKSFNLETRHPDQGGELKLSSSFLVSSVKGVFRTASAWLIEKIGRNLALGEGNFITCDYLRAYLGEDALKQDLQKNIGCPVCRVYGGSICRVGDYYREKSTVTFMFKGKSDAIYPEMRVLSYRFAHQQISGKSKEAPLEVEALKIDPDKEDLELLLQPANDLSIALVCLAADLISSGFFRFGRFTSRGYGLVRLIPLKEYYLGTLHNLLEDTNYINCLSALLT